MKNVWTRWKKIAKIAANIQADILLSAVYILIIIPVSLIFKILRLVKNKEQLSSSFWITRRKIKQDKNWAKGQ